MSLGKIARKQSRKKFYVTTNLEMNEEIAQKVRKKWDNCRKSAENLSCLELEKKI